MKPEDEQTLRRILAEARIPDSDEWVDDAEHHGLAVLEKAIFLREAWRPIFRKTDAEWVDETIKDLESRSGRKDLYSLLCSPEIPDLLAALQRIKAAGVNDADLTTVVREYQMSLLGWLMSILEGGHCFEDGLSDNWVLVGREPNELESPPLDFGPLKEWVWEFDPDKDA